MPSHRSVRLAALLVVQLAALLVAAWLVASAVQAQAQGPAAAPSAPTVLVHGSGAGLPDNLARCRPTSLHAI